jgi:molybdate transport system substrate-binding protein
MICHQRLRTFVLPVLLSLLCGAPGGAASAQDITVSAAASLQNALRDIGTAWQAARPSARVHFNFAASGALLAQLAQGAPVDVFASADLDTMDRAQARGLIAAESRSNFAANELVLVSPRARAASFKLLSDLARPEVQRIAVGTPSGVPAGHYAQAALERAGLWAALTPKLVFAENVRQSLNYVSRAEVDAGFVYRTDALLDKDTVRIDFAVPVAGGVLYPIARVAAGRNAQGAPSAPSAQSTKTADDFIDFVKGAPGQAVLERHGFKPP